MEVFSVDAQLGGRTWKIKNASKGTVFVLRMRADDVSTVFVKRNFWAKEEIATLSIASQIYSRGLPINAASDPPFSIFLPGDFEFEGKVYEWSGQQLYDRGTRNWVAEFRLNPRAIRNISRIEVSEEYLRFVSPIVAAALLKILAHRRDGKRAHARMFLSNMFAARVLEARTSIRKIRAPQYV
jgi:hypothetical protein